MAPEFEYLMPVMQSFQSHGASAHSDRCVLVDESCRGMVEGGAGKQTIIDTLICDCTTIEVDWLSSTFWNLLSGYGRLQLHVPLALYQNFSMELMGDFPSARNMICRLNGVLVGVWKYFTHSTRLQDRNHKWAWKNIFTLQILNLAIALHGMYESALLFEIGELTGSNLFAIYCTITAIYSVKHHNWLVKWTFKQIWILKTITQHQQIFPGLLWAHWPI
jgi:hypothetical protein